MNFKKWSLKKILTEVLFFFVLMFILSNIINYLRQPEKTALDLSQIEVTLLDGSMFKYEEGKPLVVYFWATWCPICKLEASNIESVSQAHNVLSIAVNSGDKEKIKKYIKKYNITLPVINDHDSQWAKRFNVEVFPSIFIYDSQGVLQFIEVGYTTTAGLEARLKWIN